MVSVPSGISMGIPVDRNELMGLSEEERTSDTNGCVGFIA